MDEAHSQLTTSRRWSLRTLAATAITAVALSGVGGAALAVASDGGGSSGGRPGGMTGKFHGQPPNGVGQRVGMPGQMLAPTNPALPRRP